VQEVALKSVITVENVWFYDDLIELKISFCKGNSLFTNKVYVGNGQISELVSALKNP